ncbi:hypothetical protein APX70_08445 [Pseudomonas syringae pv. maculicola]|uniref:Uncharacterized protein n=1 Tax=Pseudomonas syringae pv. maculicola TaxID=59511 RepID=A0A3M2U0V3_PSEYM|nr:hypothetical protein APX70_08445 [Pseudomonas syringae pv. maculicola]
MGRKQISSSTYSDKRQLASVLEQARAEIRNEGYDLMPWTMPAGCALCLSRLRRPSSP